MTGTIIIGAVVFIAGCTVVIAGEYLCDHIDQHIKQKIQERKQRWAR